MCSMTLLECEDDGTICNWANVRQAQVAQATTQRLRYASYNKQPKSIDDL
jgi:hypothetical protein